MQFLKRLKPMVSPLQNSAANTIYVDTDNESIKVGTGASGTSERSVLSEGGPNPFSLYSVGTPGAANYERLTFGWQNSAYEVLGEYSGTGSARNMRLGTLGAANLIFATNSVDHMIMSSTGVLNVCANTATPAAGSTSARLVFGTTAGFGIYYGSGAPTVSAAQGSIYLRSDGSSTSTRLYVNTNGTTGWTNVTTAA